MKRSRTSSGLTSVKLGFSQSDWDYYPRAGIETIIRSIICEASGPGSGLFWLQTGSRSRTRPRPRPGASRQLCSAGLFLASCSHISSLLLGPPTTGETLCCRSSGGGKFHRCIRRHGDGTKLGARRLCLPLARMCRLNLAPRQRRTLTIR